MDKLTYNVEETGKALGLSRASAYKAVHDGSIPTIRLGRRIVVPRVQLEKLLNGKQADAKQIERPMVEKINMEVTNGQTD
ncbi:MAG: helix-turn-helix domain-containing protein [Dehalococcoidia bacterium]